MFQKKIEFSNHQGPVYCLSKNTNSFFSSSADKFIVRWDLSKFIQDKFVVKVNSSAFSIYHLINLPYLIIGCSNGNIHVIDTESKKEIKFLEYHKSAIFLINEILEKNYFFTGDAEGNLCFWNNQDFKLIRKIPLNCGKIRSTHFFENDILIGSKDGKLRFIDIDYLTPIEEISINTEGVQAILKMNDQYLIGGYDGYLYFLDPKSKKIVSKIPAHKGPIYSLTRMNKDCFISGSRDKSIKIWNINSLKVIDKKDFKTGGHRNSVNCIISLDEKSFVSCSDDSNIILWSQEF